MIDVVSSKLLTPEFMRGFFFVIGVLIVANIGAILGGAVALYKWLKKIRKDLNEAWTAIRLIRTEIENVKSVISPKPKPGDERWDL